MEEKHNTEDAFVAWLAGESDVKPEIETSATSDFQELEQTWDLAGTSHAWKNCNPDQAWSGIAEKIDANPRIVRIRRFSYLKYAALFISLFTLGTITYLMTRNITEIKQELIASGPVLKTIQTVAHPLEPTTVILPDGTTVQMNANSTLKYPEQFSGTERKVEFTGEAYFQVIHDPTHPFVVEMKDIRVEDIGTSFNILAYPGKDRLEVNVTDGSVRLVDNSRNESAIIVAGSRGNIRKEDAKILVSGELSPNFLSWKTKEISFHHTPLSTVFDLLEDIYHIRIEIVDPKIAGITYTANFEKNQIDDIVNVIARTHHLSVEKQADTYVFASK